MNKQDKPLKVAIKTFGCQMNMYDTEVAEGVMAGAGFEIIREGDTEEGKIVPGRVSKLNRTQQRQLTNAIKRARHLALLPTSAKHF